MKTFLNNAAAFKGPIYVISHRLVTKVNLWYQDTDPFMLIERIVCTNI